MANAIHIVGTSGEVTLAAAAADALTQADLLVASDHQLEVVAEHLASKTQRIAYPSPLSKLKLMIEHCQGSVVLLASGDPLFYGIGAWLGRNFPIEQLQFHANVSSVQAAFARLKRPWQQAQVVSLHGRPLSSLRASLNANSLYAILTSADNHPALIAQELVDCGFADADCWVCENLGLNDEQVRHFRASELTDSTFSPLNVLVLETHQNRGFLPVFPGIADEAFITGAEPGRGMLSKREVRLNILSLLAPSPGETGWDVGAGCGGVAVEWARWNPQGQVHAVEYHDDRLPHLHANRERFGVVKNLHIVEGMAPEVLSELPAPNAIFVGGSSGDLAAILDLCWQHLQPGGRLVCAAVTEDTRYRLHQFAEQLDAANSEYLEIAVAKGGELGGRLVLRPQMPVLLVRWQKPADQARGQH